MKALAVAVLLLALSAGTASARSHRHASLRALNLTPPTFRGSGFAPHERVTVRLRGLRARPVHVVRANARGSFRVRLRAAPVCRAWTVRAVGARGGRAVYHHARCASLETDVEGNVQRGPITNICSDQTPCNAPAPGVTVQAFKSGRLVAETTTDGKGRFTFALADGSYTIVAVGRGTEPQTIQVAGSSLVRVDFLIDTGIR